MIKILRILILFNIVFVSFFSVDVIAQGNSDTVTAFDWSPDGTQVAIGRANSTFEIFNVITNQIELTFNPSNLPINSIAWNPVDSSEVAVAMGNVVGVINVTNTQNTLYFEVVERVTSITWSPDGTKIAGGVSQFTFGELPPNVVVIWDSATGGILSTLVSHTDIVNAVAWSPDGSKIISGSADTTAIIWDVNNETPLLVLEPYEGLITSLVWKPDSSQVATASTGNFPVESRVEVWDLNSNLSVANYEGNYVSSIDWHPINNWLAIADNNAIQIFDIENNNIIQFYQQSGVIKEVDWNPSGTQFAYSGAEANIQITIEDSPQSSNYTPTPIPTLTSPPTSGNFTVTSRIDGQDDNQQSIFVYTLTNTSSTPQSNLYMRLFFTVDNGRSADDYLLQSYYDSSNALTISGPFQWDATNHYFILSYGSSTLAPNASYQFQGVLRLSDWSNNYSASNDWWHTGILNFQDSQTDYLPVYANGVLNTGLVPSGTPQPTTTPVSTTVPVSTSTPNGTALLQIESRIDGNDDTQQAGFRYRLSNISTQAQGNLSTRIYFTLDGSQVASDYVLEKYFDQSGVATVSSPILASGNTYYFEVSYGATSLQPNSAWEFQGALHLVNYASNFSSSNDWWHTGIGSAYQVTTYIPTYINAVIEVGQEP